MTNCRVEAEIIQRIGGHHADFRIRRDGGRADRVGVELHELAETARAGLLVAEHPAAAIAAIGLGQRVEILGHVAGERRGQVVAQRQPLLVVVLEREHALVRAVLVRQELAERVGVLDERRLDALEAVELVGLADLREHALGGGEIGGTAIGEAARRASLDFVGFGHGFDGRFLLGKRALRPNRAKRGGARAIAGPCRPSRPAIPHGDEADARLERRRRQ